MQKDGPYCPQQLLFEQFFCMTLTFGDIWVDRLKWPTLYMKLLTLLWRFADARREQLDCPPIRRSDGYY